MKHFRREVALAASGINDRTRRMVVMIITIALFMLSAGAPNAMIGIGK